MMMGSDLNEKHPHRVIMGEKKRRRGRPRGLLPGAFLDFMAKFHTLRPIIHTIYKTSLEGGRGGESKNQVVWRKKSYHLPILSYPILSYPLRSKKKRKKSPILSLSPLSPLLSL